MLCALLLAGCVDTGQGLVRATGQDAVGDAAPGAVAQTASQTASPTTSPTARSNLAKAGAEKAVNPAPKTPIVLVVGDSMFAANRFAGASVARVIEKSLGADVTDYSTVGARYFLGIPLRPQYRAGNWDWVVINGGGNDLLFGCGCGKCTRVLDRLVSADGQGGIIPAFVAKIRASGAKVVYSGYLRNPGVQTPIKSCGPAGNELDRRLTLMAGRDPGVTFLPMSDLVPHGDRSYHGIDLIHPSVKGSRAIGQRIAAVIARKK